ncbi:hypothetical protein [Synechococcus sp. PCC 7336]|uniref:hypothetical protein n=1 Tax=Synechococcus sp. PCC 7336 TaxID=195250 RepID=UPI0012EA4D0F|nr:hypothetical protein [Synechococcus sp. PCC 7336]
MKAKAINFAWVGILVFLFTCIVRMTAEAQRADDFSYLLTNSECVSFNTSSSYGNYVSDDTGNVSIGRELLRARFSVKALRNSATIITCNLNSGRPFSTLNLKFGLSDASISNESAVEMNIYKDGNTEHSYNEILPGSLVSVPMNILNSSSVAIEVLCLRARSGSCNLLFFEAELIASSSLPQGSSPSGQTELERKYPQLRTQERESQTNNNRTGERPSLDDLNDGVNDLNRLRRSIESFF